MPGAEQEIGQMAEMLGGFMTEKFLSGDAAFGVDESSSAESEAILKEAAAVAESSAGQMFPSVPTSNTRIIYYCKIPLIRKYFSSKETLLFL